MGFIVGNVTKKFFITENKKSFIAPFVIMPTQHSEVMNKLLEKAVEDFNMVCPNCEQPMFLNEKTDEFYCPACD